MRRCTLFEPGMATGAVPEPAGPALLLAGGLVPGLCARRA